MINRIDQRRMRNARDPENTVCWSLNILFDMSTDDGFFRYGASPNQHGKRPYDETQYLSALTRLSSASITQNISGSYTFSQTRAS